VDFEQCSDGIEESKADSNKDKKKIILNEEKANIKNSHQEAQGNSPEQIAQFQSDFSNRTLGICINKKLNFH
jgi:hypothetical protein